MSRIILMCGTLLVYTAVTVSQPPVSPPRTELVKITDTICKINCIADFPISTVASVGDDGILLVDTGLPQTAQVLLETIQAMGKKFKIVINTHAHGDHTGGNDLLGQQALIIAHKNVRKRLESPEYFLNNITRDAMPVILVDDELTLFFNGEEIRVVHLPHSHTDGDVFVHFVKSKIVALGDLVFPDWFPYIAYVDNGSLKGYTGNIKFFIDSFEPGTLFISAHGRDYTKDDLVKYLDMLTRTTELIRAQMDQGKDLKSIQGMDILAPWNAWVGRWINKDAWAQAVYEGLSQKEGVYKESITGPLLDTISSSGVDAAIEQYHELKKTKIDQYDFQEVRLNILGYYLLNKNRPQDAIKIFKLNAQVFPDSWNVYDSLAEAYMNTGDNKLAIENYEKSVKLNPQNDNGQQKLTELKSKR
jgi:cyclase